MDGVITKFKQGDKIIIYKKNKQSNVFVLGLKGVMVIRESNLNPNKKYAYIQIDTKQENNVMDQLKRNFSIDEINKFILGREFAIIENELNIFKKINNKIYPDE